METSSLTVGSLALVTYGPKGTQIVRVREVKKSGALVVDRFITSYGGRWTTSESPVPASKVLGPVPGDDSRLAVVMARLTEAAVAAR